MKPREASVEGGERSSVEVRARTVDEAVARGLVRLGGLSRAEVEIEVLSEGKTGVLGFGAEDAVVRLTVVSPSRPQGEVAASTSREPGGEAASTMRRAAPPREEPAAPTRRSTGAHGASAAAASPTAAPQSDAKTVSQAPQREAISGQPSEAIVQTAIEITSGYLVRLGYEDVEVEPGASLLPIEVEDEASLVLNIRGTGVRRLLKDDGRPLLALQFLIRLALNRAAGTWVNLLLDVDGDRARRVAELFDLAEQSAALVDREGRPVALPPMTPYERRVVHLALRDHPDVTTQSIGRGDARKVTVRLKGQLLAGV